MNKYYFEWETVFDDNFPEKCGDIIVEAETLSEARKKFYKNLPIYGAIISYEEEVGGK